MAKKTFINPDSVHVIWKNSEEDRYNKLSRLASFCIFNGIGISFSPKTEKIKIYIRRKYGGDKFYLVEVSKENSDILLIHEKYCEGDLKFDWSWSYEKTILELTEYL